MLLKLNLFETKDLHMINRVLSSGNKFTYLCKSMNNNGNGNRPYNNDIALLMKIKECQFMPDGKCKIEGIMEKRVIVKSSWMEQGTQGLWYITYEDYKDIKVQNENDDNDKNNGNNNKINPEHLQLIDKFINFVYRGKNEIIQTIEKECGHRVMFSETNQEKWSFWISGLIYKIFGKNGVSLSWIKHQLHTRSTLGRVGLCYHILKSQLQEWDRS